MQRPTTTSYIVATEPMLVPPMVYGLHVSREDQQKRWQRTQLVDPLLSLHFHPVLNPLPVVPFSPLHQIHDHNPGVEVARVSGREYPGKNRVGPERVSEILGEIRVAVFGGTDDTRRGKVGLPELDDVVDHDHVGVEVNHAVNAGIENVSEVVPGVVQRVLESLSDRGGD